jgi:hypothetical protein
MRRWLLPTGLAVLIVGVVLTLAGNYGRQLVHDQLAAQKITFAPYDQSAQNGDNYEAYPQLRDRAGDHGHRRAGRPRLRHLHQRPRE